MPTRRVFVIWTHPLFLDSVRLLLTHPEVDLVGTASDYEIAQERALELQPDTFLIEETGGNIPSRMTDILQLCTWNTRVVSLNLDNNKLSVYHREFGTVGQADDLLQLILSE